MAKKKCVMFGLTTFAQMLRVYMERYSDVEVEHPLFAKGAGGSQCKGLPRTCGQMVSCEQAKQALKCGNTKLDRDKDGVPCESICPGG